MSEYDEEETLLAEVTPEAWQSFYDIMEGVSNQLDAWATKHDLPTSIMAGAAMGIASAIIHFADLCDCDTCLAVPTSFADEVINRVTDAESSIKRAVH